MQTDFWQSIGFTLIPAVAMVAGCALAALRPPGARTASAIQHFAAGVVFAAVAIELLPLLEETGSLPGMAAGFVAGVAAMIAIKKVAESGGMLVPVGIDLLIDGLLVGIGFAAGTRGGMILLAALTLEILFLGLSVAAAQTGAGHRRAVVLATALGLGLLVPVGAGIGLALAGTSGALLAAILGFGVSTLLYLVTEELLEEAHETQDTPLVTATFFAGFLAVYLFSAVEG